MSGLASGIGWDVVKASPRMQTHGRPQSPIVSRTLQFWTPDNLILGGGRVGPTVGRTH